MTEDTVANYKWCNEATMFLLPQIYRADFVIIITHQLDLTFRLAFFQLRAVWRSAVIGVRASKPNGLISCSGLQRTLLRPGLPCRAVHVTPNVSNVKNPAQPVEEELSPFTKLIEAMGFTGPLKYSKWKIKIAGLRMYTCCVERIDYDDLFEIKVIKGKWELQKEH
ncbi:uncharacterized protein LOC109915834 [Rhincodon typus]|uniref:uncharacterized protein LOC109915834 n=1 Tax=Rhincodon typus TaxID=259920 RepID=UPI00202F50E5|nr:uncharacterized protein LOC109915834 [Rhincodon typus]